MVQFGSYLSQVVTIQELTDRLPSIGTLLSEYHINADVAFFLARPLFIHMLNVSNPSGYHISVPLFFDEI